MDRRGFLRGTFGGVMAGGILLKLDDDAKQTASIIRLEETLITSPEVGRPVVIQGCYEPGNMVFDFYGNPVGIITSINHRHTEIDVTHAGSARRQVISGPMQVTAEILISGSFRSWSRKGGPNPGY